MRTNENLSVFHLNVDFLTFRERRFQSDVRRNANCKAVTPTLQGLNSHLGNLPRSQNLPTPLNLNSGVLFVGTDRLVSL